MVGRVTRANRRKRSEHVRTRTYNEANCVARWKRGEKEEKGNEETRRDENYEVAEAPRQATPRSGADSGPQRASPPLMNSIRCT